MNLATDRSEWVKRLDRKDVAREFENQFHSVTFFYIIVPKTETYGINGLKFKAKYAERLEY